MVVKTQDIVSRPKSWLKPPRRRRKRIDQARVRELARSIRKLGLMNPPECLPDGEIVSGDYRWQALMLIDEITEVPVRIVDLKEAHEIRIRRVSENLQRTDLSVLDKFEECKGFMDDRPGTTQKEIAEMLSVDPSTITRIMSLDHCIEEVKQAADEIGVKAVYEVSKEPPERQRELLAAALAGGAKRVAEARQSSIPRPDAPKATNLKIPLPGGKAVIVKGKNTLPEVLDLLRRAVKAVEADKKLDARKFQQKMRHLSKAVDVAVPDEVSPSDIESPGGSTCQTT
jgi:ParB/RepB/Spo0J family partition protein